MVWIYANYSEQSLSLFRDVAAGICVLQEAGGLVTTANPPLDGATAPVEDAHLGGRLYLAIRYASLLSTGSCDADPFAGRRETVQQRLVARHKSAPFVKCGDE